MSIRRFWRVEVYVTIPPWHDMVFERPQRRRVLADRHL